MPEREKQIVIRNLSLGRAAMLLALSSTREEEENIKIFLMKHGFNCVATEIGGLSDNIKSKILNAAIGAALNRGIIKKESKELHALIHASIEAERGLMLDMPVNASIAIKLAIVRDESWIAVAIFGQSAIHTLTNHERAGLGFMHIG